MKFPAGLLVIYEEEEHSIPEEILMKREKGNGKTYIQNTIYMSIIYEFHLFYIFLGKQDGKNLLGRTIPISGCSQKIFK